MKKFNVQKIIFLKWNILMQKGICRVDKDMLAESMDSMEELNKNHEELLDQRRDINLGN